MSDIYPTATLPKDRKVWIVSDEGVAREVSFSPDHWLYEKREVWWPDDGEPDNYERSEIIGWTEDSFVARQAAKQAAGNVDEVRDQ